MRELRACPSVFLAFYRLVVFIPWGCSAPPAPHGAAARARHSTGTSQRRRTTSSSIVGAIAEENRPCHTPPVSGLHDALGAARPPPRPSRAGVSPTDRRHHRITGRGPQPSRDGSVAEGPGPGSCWCPSS